MQPRKQYFIRIPPREQKMKRIQQQKTLGDEENKGMRERIY